MCSSLVSNPHVVSFERCAVVLYLSAHAVELFLKGAIRRKIPKEGCGHDLQQLYKRYKVLYPKKSFEFTELPFVLNRIESCGKIYEQNKFDHKNPNELYRYPRNKKGDSMGVMIGFEANSFLKKLKTLRVDFARIVNELDSQVAPS